MQPAHLCNLACTTWAAALLCAACCPRRQRQAVGPFVFFDHFGPVHAQPGDNHDVRPHPHIGLSTVTYLFEGAMQHRDSTGAVQRMEPGQLNWMTAYFPALCFKIIQLNIYFFIFVKIPYTVTAGKYPSNCIKRKQVADYKKYYGHNIF